MAQSQSKDQEHNPKRDPAPQSNTEKDPADWVTGGEPMTGAQASYMKTLSEIANEPEAFDESLTKAEASMRIDELKEKTGR
ncbi:MAG TPA: DUF3072 domain-containing protein [Beijerinckiaceae bacterium]|jgi:hypothetical protein|nr:DUF3072 domain-containing protein [Beijerinckiaceae bacterium]